MISLSVRFFCHKKIVQKIFIIEIEELKTPFTNKKAPADNSTDA